MRGASIAFGEEPELIQRVRRNLEDKTIYYDPQLSVDHLVNPEKWNIIKALKRCPGWALPIPGAGAYRRSYRLQAYRWYTSGSLDIDL